MLKRFEQREHKRQLAIEARKRLQEEKKLNEEKDFFRPKINKPNKSLVSPQVSFTTISEAKDDIQARLNVQKEVRTLASLWVPDISQTARVVDAKEKVKEKVRPRAQKKGRTVEEEKKVPTNKIAPAIIRPGKKETLRAKEEAPTIEANSGTGTKGRSAKTGTSRTGKKELSKKVQVPSVEIVSKIEKGTGHGDKKKKNAKGNCVAGGAMRTNGYKRT